MRKYLKYCLILYLTFNFNVLAQESLIENGSFEVIDSCITDLNFPPFVSSIQFAYGWTDASAPSVTYVSSDLFKLSNRQLLALGRSFVNCTTQ